MRAFKLLCIVPATALLGAPPSAQVILKRWPNYTPVNAHLDTLPDLDGDGFREFVYADLDWDNPSGGDGRVRWASGKTGVVLHEIQSTTKGESLGRDLRVVGDVTGDGFPDVMFSTFYDGFVRDGRDATLVHAYPFRTAYPTPLGDVSGNGLADVLLGAQAFESGSWSPLYQVHWPWMIDGHYVIRFRFSAVALDDVNGDGVPDFAVGAPGEVAFEADDNIGFVFVYSGATGEELYRLRAPGDCAPFECTDWFGYSLASVGDRNGDGIGDLAVGAPSFDVPTGGHGALFFFDGATGKLLSSIESQGRTEGRHALFVFAPGDVDGNGFDDVLYSVRDLVAMENLTRLIDGETGELLASYRLALPRIAGGHDWDGDGFPDYVLQHHLDPTVVAAYTLFSGAPPGVTTLGLSCPETGGPRIGITGSPAIGQPLRIHLSEIEPDRTAVLLLGTLRDGVDPSAPPGRRCPVLVEPFLTVTQKSERLRPGEGRVTFACNVPDRPELVGREFYAQWILLPRPGTGERYTVTRALRAVVQ